MTFALLLALCTPLSVPMEPADGNAILQRIDAQLQNTKSQILTLDMAIEDPGRAPRRIGLQMHMRGDKRRVAFLYPGDMKGMQVLNLSAEQTYVYLPAFRKVRRIASHLRDQTLFGSDYTFDDFGNIALHQNYSGAVTHEDEEYWHMTATPKKQSGPAAEHIELRVKKKSHTVEELKYFDAAGTLSRTETRGDFQCGDSGCAPRKTKMVNHRHDNHWTEVTISRMQLNVDFPEHIFSLRALQRNE
jgi:outer membrane lipoprotein-sorting protein